MSDGGLQFEKAEFADGRAAETAACGYCQQPLGDSYWSVDGMPACAACKDHLAARGTEGSGVTRFARAVLFGIIAGAMGAGLWYAVRAIMGWELGLISILVGLAVGGAVKAGSYGRGGPLYQTLAVFITYTSICSNYVPDIVQGLETKWGDDLVSMVLLPILVLASAYVAPFLGGFQGILGLAIIAFGLYEAGKINRRDTAEISGPHAVAPPATPAVPGSSPGG